MSISKKSVLGGSIMPLFAIREGKARKLDIKLHNDDKNLQGFIEHNSEEILGVYYIASDFSANDR